MITVFRRILALLVVAGGLQGLAVGHAYAWWNGDWQYRVKIDADAGPHGAAIADPIGRTQILVRLFAGNFKFDGVKNDGGDLRFVAGDDRTPLHYHIEKIDPLVDQVALIWVDVPDLAPGATTSFYLYWGNDKANDASDPHATYDPDQLAVWHFDDANGLAHDSTAYGNNAATAGKRDDGGIVGFGQKFDGTAPIKFAPNPTLNIAAAQPYTWQIWLKPKDVAGSAVLFDQRDTGGVAGLTIGLDAGKPYAAIAGTTPIIAAAAKPLVADAWHLLTVTAADKITVYVDGVQAAQAAGSLPAIAGAMVLGGPVAAAAPAASPVAPAPPGASPAPPVPVPAAPVAAAPLPYQGELDELQISKVARGPGIIAIADKSQGPQADLIALETPEQTSAFGSGFIGIILRSVTPDAWVVIGILMVMAVTSWVVMVIKARYVGGVAAANKRFRLAFQQVFAANHNFADFLPAIPENRLRAVRGSCLFALYHTGERELHERLNGGRTLADGSIAPQSLNAIHSAMDATMVREAEKLGSLMVVLTICIAGGPFIGLLGTVVGVMITFAAIAAAGDVNVNAIAPGISAALLATVAGLFVAIPALFAYNYFQIRIRGLNSEMAVFVDEVVTRIAEGNLGRKLPPPQTMAAE